MKTCKGLVNGYPFSETDEIKFGQYMEVEYFSFDPWIFKVAWCHLVHFRFFLKCTFQNAIPPKDVVIFKSSFYRCSLWRCTQKFLLGILNIKIYFKKDWKWQISRSRIIVSNFPTIQFSKLYFSNSELFSTKHCMDVAHLLLENLKLI